jgi:hypothetical protein
MEALKFIKTLFDAKFWNVILVPTVPEHTDKKVIKIVKIIIENYTNLL